MSTRRFCEATRTELDAIRFLQAKGVLRRNWQCKARCGNVHEKLYARRGSYFHSCAKCSEQKWVTAGTWLHGARLTVIQVIDFVHSWCAGLKRAVLRRDSEISSKVTSTDWARFCREICVNALLMLDGGVIGAPGHVIEVDESKFSKKKYNRGRDLKKGWVFGGFDRTTKRCFFEFVEDRTATTLLSIIQRRVARGSIIITDEFRSYKRLSELGYGHMTVNLSENFVDPVSRAHTQNIECCWGCLKRFLRSIGRNLGAHTGEYFSEYIYRQRYSSDLEDQFWKDVAVQFPLENQ